jgi:RimJ/RimL family protein N-acetyltransferase/ADP-ribose pyrophosphatase YjhB (NUDIX family)
VSVPAQPVLRDGVVALRPATPEELGATRVHRDQAVARPVVRFLVEHEAGVAGSAEIRLNGHGAGDLSWAMTPAHRGQGIGLRVVRLLIRYAFEELGLHRVTAYVDPQDRESLRICGGAGLRREGLVRGARPGMEGGVAATATPDSPGGGQDGRRGDYVQLARLATDPEPTSGGGFIPVLNAGLPTKRVIAQGLIHNGANEILLCELTYKQEWDLPGGVVDPHESPAQAVVREISEEMQIQVSPRSLRAVNWLPPWRGWDDAMLFVFDLGAHDDVLGRARLEPREIRALHWCTPDRVERHAAPYLTRMLRFLARQKEGTAYLEDGADRS